MNWKRPVEYSVLAATFLALVAHGGGSPGKICGLAREKVSTYEVIGHCGPEGRITITEAKGSCNVTVTGDEVGIPRRGDNQHSLVLEGFSETSEEELRCTITSVARELGRKEIICTGADDSTCTSFLLEDCDGCQDLRCTVPVCAEDERLDFSSDKACPTCEACSSCSSKPTPPPEPVCDLEACPALECDSNFEEREGECCPTCEPLLVEELCEAGQAEYALQWEEAKDSWLDCTEDAHCMIISTVSRCSGHCGVLMSGPAFGAPYSAVASDAEILCQHCEQPDLSCEEPTDEIACVDGLCQIVTP